MYMRSNSIKIEIWLSAGNEPKKVGTVLIKMDKLINDSRVDNTNPPFMNIS